MTDDPVMSLGEWRTNGEMIADIARCGYIRPTDRVLDMTYGRFGGWWSKYRPSNLMAIDIDPARVPPGGERMDFTCLPMAWTDLFDVVAFDPPYKLNGQPDPGLDHRYGVENRATRDQRHELMCLGLDEAARVVKPRGFVLAKCQDQVEGGKVRWQTDMLTERGAKNSLVKVDSFLLRSYRSQPKGTTQKHARHNYSTCLIFRKTP